MRFTSRVVRAGRSVSCGGAVLLSCGLTSAAAAHGSMAYPISRVYAGFLEDPQSPDSAAVAAAIAVNGTQPFYDWTEVVNFHPGSPEYQMDIDYALTIPDGQLASGGNPKYAGLDLVRDDWPATPMSAGVHEFKLYAPTPHDPNVMHAWITSAAWNPSLPLTWSMMEPVPITTPELEGNFYSFNALIPARSGKHCFYLIWQRIDPVGEGFYSLSDLDFDAAGGEECQGDLDGDGAVNGADIAALLGAWGTSAFDLDGDGIVAGGDLAVVLAAWGACGPDCDGDGVDDATAIFDGLVPDCNQNLVPDSCDLAAGGDTDGNGVLDSCQLDGITYTWTVTDQWSGGFIATLTFTNGSDEMLHDWQLAFDTPSYSITNLWNGVVIDVTEQGVVVANAPWNGHLDPGSSLTVGYQGSGTPTAPASVTLDGSPVLPAG